MILFLFLLFLCNACANNEIVKLNSTNNIILRGEINKESTSKFIYDLNLKKDKNNTILYLNTPGGSVIDGMKIVSEVKKYNMSCIAESAFSMGFIIFQACKDRLILPHGRLMQHQMALGIMDQKNRIESYMAYINELDEKITQEQAARINITTDEFKNNIKDDWWLYGEKAVEKNCADKIVEVECTRDLTKGTTEVEQGLYTYKYSNCPLVSQHVSKKKNKNNNEFFIPLF